MKYAVYESPDEALTATDAFYANGQGFQYTADYVTQWLGRHLTFPKTGRVLDLCCGDGIWSWGMRQLHPNLEYHGIDISAGAIEKARTLMDGDAGRFLIGDTESELPYPDGHFDLIFARGPGLYNQHSMDRSATIVVIEAWHRKLKPVTGRFYSLFASQPEHMGTYTAMEDVKLPYNRCPRKTDTIDFRGGKYHHSIESFMTPFWKAANASIVSYAFQNNLHILITQSKP